MRLQPAFTLLLATIAAATATAGEATNAAAHWIAQAGLASAKGPEADALRNAITEMHHGLVDARQSRVLTPAELAWTCEALHTAGLFDPAEHLLAEALAAVRIAPGGPLPVGSLPSAISGPEAPRPSPYVFDAEAGTWILCAVQRHVSMRPERSGIAFAGQHWRTLAHMADFLDTWRYAAEPEPLYTALPDSGRSGLRPQSTLSFYLGLRASLSLAHILGRPVPDSWAQRVRTLEGLLTALGLAGSRPLTVDATLAAYARRVEPDLAEASRITLRVGDMEQFLEALRPVPAQAAAASPLGQAALRFLQVAENLYTSAD